MPGAPSSFLFFLRFRSEFLIELSVGGIFCMKEKQLQLVRTMLVAQMSRLV